MLINKVEIRSGVYYDSVTLMQLQAALTKLAGIRNAGVMMGTAANRELLEQNGLLDDEARKAQDSDLIVSVQGEDDASVEAALGQVDSLLVRRLASGQQDYLPKSLAAAAQMLPDAGWVLVSVPGRYAAGVARDALRLQKNVFLYSDNVAPEDEISLKKEAAGKGLLVMGPDCGTAIINGVGLGFANKVRRGPIGLVGASGTGLQQVTARIHQLGGGITHALGTGGRDLSRDVGGITARQAFDLLIRDPETKVIVLISKPPSPEVAASLLQDARAAGKHIVINFIGHTIAGESSNLHSVSSLDAAAERGCAGSREDQTRGGGSRHANVLRTRPEISARPFLRRDPGLRNFAHFAGLSTLRLFKYSIKKRAGPARPAGEQRAHNSGLGRRRFHRWPAAPDARQHASAGTPGAGGR